MLRSFAEYVQANPSVHHTGNVLAFGIPMAALINHVPTVLQAALSFFGCVWYCILITDRLPGIAAKLKSFWRKK